MKTAQITFTGIPPKYDRIDKFISRSGQPQKDDFAWLKSQGVTDVINFRRNKSANTVDYPHSRIEFYIFLFNMPSAYLMNKSFSGGTLSQAELFLRHPDYQPLSALPTNLFSEVLV